MHLKVASPAMVRVDGDLQPLEQRLLTESDLETVLLLVTDRSPAKRELFLESGDLDTSYLADGIGRFRVNGFRQRGSISFAFRFVPKEIPSFERLGLPEGVGQAGAGAPRPRPRDGRDRLGQVDVARGDAQLDQPQPQAAHRHDRGPDRVHPRRLGLDRQPARGRARHRVLQAGPAPRAAPGPRRHPDRRASRRGDDADRPPGGRVRATSSSRRCTRSTRPRRSAGSSSSTRPRSR